SAARGAVEDSRACRKIATSCAGEVRAETETAGRARRELVIRGVAERVGGSCGRSVAPDERAAESIVRGKLAQRHRMVVVGRNVVADGDRSKTTDVEGVRIATAVDERTT